MRVVVALGGNALLRRGEPMTLERQRANVCVAALALAPLAVEHQLLISHGNGPQVGLLALQGLAYDPGDEYPMDVLGAETDGMIGYLIAQELAPLLPQGVECVTVLTRIEVDAGDPAFAAPTKFVGPQYDQQQAESLAARNAWKVARDGDSWRRVVPSPNPRRILEMRALELLVSAGMVVICAGGGGIPVARDAAGLLRGVDAVIDKDLASALLAREAGAGALLMLTDVDGVYDGWRTSAQRTIRHISPDALSRRELAAGSMAPKAKAACEFVEATGGVAAIGRLRDAAAMLAGEAGTRVSLDAGDTQWWTP